MISPLQHEQIVDLTAEPLGPGWLRRLPTTAETREIMIDGVRRTGPEGRFREALIEALDRAAEVALLSSFLLADDLLAEAMLRAAKRGVRVYVLTASEQRIGKVVREDEVFEQMMADKHEKLLESLAGKVLLRSAEHIHAKFLVTDPQSPAKALAWLSTANFNKALEDNIELGVALDAAGAAAMAACFQWAFWCEAERELRGERRLIEIRPNYPARPPRPDDDAVVATLRDSTRLRDRVVDLINGARDEILAASYGLAADHIAVRALVAAAQRGVRVTVLTRPRPAVAAAIAVLAKAGVCVLAHDKLHAKALVVDGEALVMSANLEAGGLDRGFEVGAVVSPRVARGVEQTLREWAATFPWVYRADTRRGEHLGDFCPVKARLRGGVVKVTDSHVQKLSAIIAPDALALETVPAPLLTPSPPKAELPRRVTFAWDVVPPRLPKGAAERRQEIEREELGKDGKPTKAITRIPHEPPLYDHGGKVYVLLNDSADVERAREAASKLRASVVLP